MFTTYQGYWRKSYINLKIIYIKVGSFVKKMWSTLGSVLLYNIVDEENIFCALVRGSVFLSKCRSASHILHRDFQCHDTSLRIPSSAVFLPASLPLGCLYPFVTTTFLIFVNKPTFSRRVVSSCITSLLNLGGITLPTIFSIKWLTFDANFPFSITTYHFFAALSPFLANFLFQLCIFVKWVYHGKKEVNTSTCNLWVNWITDLQVTNHQHTLKEVMLLATDGNAQLLLT